MVVSEPKYNLIYWEGLKILTSKQMLLMQVKADNLLNEIRQIRYSFHRAKEITKKVYNILMNSIKL